MKQNLVAAMIGAVLAGPAVADEITVLATVTRVVNLPMIVGLRLLEKQDGVNVIMAKKEIANVQGLNGVRLASHSPKSTVQSLLHFYLSTKPGIQPNVVFIPEGSPARASALLRGAVDAAAFDLSSAQVVDASAP